MSSSGLLLGLFWEILGPRPCADLLFIVILPCADGCTGKVLDLDNVVTACEFCVDIVLLSEAIRRGK